MAKGKNQGRSGPPSTSRARSTSYWAIAIGLLAAIVYLNALGNEFVLDDTRLIRDNVRIRSLANIPHFFASSYWDLEGTQGLYRPLVLATYAVNYAVHGLSTFGYTAVNIVLHGAVSLLLFALVRGIGGSLFAAGAAAAVFAVHPVHTEAVTGMAGRTELLAAFFFLIAALLHRMAPETRRGAILCRAATAAAFACALLSKESAITLLVVLPGLDALFPVMRRDSQPAAPRDRIVTDYLALVAVAILYLAVRRAVLGGITISEGAIAPLDNPMVPITTMALGERMGAAGGQALMTAFAVIAEYARLLVWPARLSLDYSYNQIALVTNAGDGRFLLGVAVVGSCLAGIVMLWRRNRIAAFGLAFLAVTFSIVSNVFVTIGTICAERLMYLPSAGALAAAAAGLERLATRLPAGRQIAYVVLGALIVSGGARTWTRNRDWKNELSVWSAAAVVAPRSARVQAEYGRVLMELAENDARAGRTVEAEQRYATAQAHFETALNIYPSYSPPMDGLATILSLHGRYDDALVLFERAVKVWPGSYASLTNWAGLLWDRSRRQAANAAALRSEGKNAEADELARQADAGYRQALEKAERAIAMHPTYAHAHLIRALVLDGYTGDRRGAIVEFETVLKLEPHHPQRAEIVTELQRLRAQP
jgi:tetratricopeptide (TPR) repeat protein